MNSVVLFTERTEAIPSVILHAFNFYLTTGNSGDFETTVRLREPRLMATYRSVAFITSASTITV
jgi:hypothetical protein